MDRQKWSLGGLLAFEALIVAYLLGNGASVLDPFPLMYAIGTVALASAVLWKPTRWLYGILALASLYRAYLQTAGGAEPGVYPTYLVPLGFAWLAIAPRSMPRLAMASVAVARTWFILWYVLQGGAGLIVVANVLGAAGAWLWVASEESAVDAASGDAPRAA